LRLELPGGTADLYLWAHLVQVPALGKQTLINWSIQQSDAVSADLVAKVLADHR
jgi:hypothetical protein